MLHDFMFRDGDVRAGSELPHSAGLWHGLERYYGSFTTGSIWIAQSVRRYA